MAAETKRIPPKCQVIRWAVFLGTLAVLALIAQAMRVSLAWPVVIAATVVALIGVGWPHRAGMLLAVLVGVVTPLILEARAQSRRSAP